MNKIILRFCIVKNSEVFEAVFDTRFSFTDNFRLFSDIYPFRLLEETRIMDLDREQALRKDVPLSHFNFRNFMTLYLF